MNIPVHVHEVFSIQCTMYCGGMAGVSLVHEYV